ncbi:MAG TPA: O-antigen ligase family protein [Thermoanaerobaculia bacterium]
MPAPGATSRHPLHAAAFVAVLATAVLLPVVFTHGLDSFRLIKDTAFVLAAIVLGALLLLAAVWGTPLLTRRDVRRAPLWLPLLAVVWTAIAFFGASHRFRATTSLIWVAAAAVIFLAAYGVAKERGFSMIWTLFLPAAVNGGLFALQALSIWNPFVFPIDMPPESRNIGLMGNSSFVAMYLLPIAVAALALASARRQQRALSIAAAVLSGAALIATTAITALVAYGAAVVTLAYLAVRRRGRPTAGRLALAIAAIVAAVAILFTVVAMTYAPLRHRMQLIREMAVHGRFDRVLTGRGTAYLTAIAMFRDNPLLGVGPGHYGAYYYDYKIRIEDRYPSLIDSPTRSLNFGEAHNDHLQTLAVSGLPGYAIFVACLVALALRSHRPRDVVEVDERGEVARALAAPLAVSFAVAALGHFPLELAASLAAFLHLAAVACAWTNTNADPS